MRIRGFIAPVIFGLGLFVVADQINAKAKLPDPWEAGQGRAKDAQMADWQRYHVLDQRGPLAHDDGDRRHV